MVYGLHLDHPQARELNKKSLTICFINWKFKNKICSVKIKLRIITKNSQRTQRHSFTRNRFDGLWYSQRLLPALQLDKKSSNISIFLENSYLGMQSFNSLIYNANSDLWTKPDYWRNFEVLIGNEEFRNASLFVSYLYCQKFCASFSTVSRTGLPQLQRFVALLDEAFKSIKHVKINFTYFLDKY